MICKCSKCGIIYEASGLASLDITMGGKDCLNCGEKNSVNLIVVKRKKEK